ncbi:MAG: hypothetical protein KAI63_00580, partial [Planctomycetes bacterium]|nr:hypothetical protein [Planctomycetota bacterium]
MSATKQKNPLTSSITSASHELGEHMYAHFLPFFAATFLNITAAQYGLIEGFALGCYHFLR